MCRYVTALCFQDLGMIHPRGNQLAYMDAHLTYRHTDTDTHRHTHAHTAHTPQHVDPQPPLRPTTTQPPQHVDPQPPLRVLQQPQPYVQPVPTTVVQQSTPPIVKPKPKFTPSGGGVRVLPSNNMATSPTASTPLLLTDGVALQDQHTPPLPRSSIQAPPPPMTPPKVARQPNPPLSHR